MANEKKENELVTGIQTDGSIEATIEQKEENIVSNTTKKVNAYSLLEEFENEQLKKELDLDL